MGLKFKAMKYKQTVIIVTAYGEDNHYQMQYEDLVGIYTSVKNAIKGAIADGMTNKQRQYLNGLNAFYWLDKAVNENKSGEAFQVDWEEETDGRFKPCESSYMFKTYTLD